MLDRTDDFLGALASSGGAAAGAAAPARKAEKHQSQTSFNGMVAVIRTRLRKAEGLHRDIAASYADFSALGMNEEERDRVDDVLMEALGQCEDQIKALERLPALEGNPGAHRKGVAWHLLDSLKDLQQRVNALRVLRQGHTLSAKSKLCPVIADAPVPRILPTETPSDLAALSPDDLLVLEHENELLEDHLLTEFEEIRKIERDAHEVSQLLAKFSEKLMEQHETINNLYEEAQVTVDLVNQVPDELLQATERSAGYRRMMLALFIGLGVFLLAMEWAT